MTDVCRRPRRTGRPSAAVLPVLSSSALLRPRLGVCEVGLILWILLGIGGFRGSVPVVVLVLAEQLQGLGGLGEDADGFGTPHLNRVSIALLGEDVGDPINGGFEPDRITSSGPGNDQLQPMLAAAAEPHKPLLRGCVRLAVRRRPGRPG